MKKFSNIHKTIFGFILAGLAFSGYLAGVKFFTATCAFGSQCPLFLGHPACYTGFIVYFALFIAMIVAMVKGALGKTNLAVMTGLSLFGTAFSGYLTMTELPVLFRAGFVAFLKSLPLCSVGFLFFLTIFILTIVAGTKKGEVAETPKA